MTLQTPLQLRKRLTYVAKKADPFGAGFFFG